MKKSDRLKIFNKYGGRCAYCGCPLQNGWHVDEIEPVRRKYKTIKGHWSNGGTNHMTEKELATIGSKWVPDRLAPDGYEFPERLHMGNQNPACASCNINKHSDSLESFRKSIEQFVESLNQYSVQYKIAKRYGLVKETGLEVKFYFEVLKNQSS